MTESRKTDYFDFIIEARGRGEPWVGALGDFNHWGYWDEPERARADTTDMEASQQRLTDELLKMANLKDGMEVLDVGCGMGGTLRTIDGRHQGMHMHGLDFDERLVQLTRDNVKGSGTNTVEVQQGCATKLPWADASMDVVTAVECIFHFPSRAAFLSEAWRVLRPGGRLVICDYLIANVPEPLMRRRQLLARSPALKWLGRLDFIGLAGYRELSQQAGFSELISQDITANTLPTYDSRVAFFKSTGLPMRAMGPRIAGMRLAELASRIGVFRYVNIAMVKEIA